jgi:hypothetical protein
VSAVLIPRISSDPSTDVQNASAAWRTLADFYRTLGAGCLGAVVLAPARAELGDLQSRVCSDRRIFMRTKLRYGIFWFFPRRDLDYAE